MRQCLWAIIAGLLLVACARADCLNDLANPALRGRLAGTPEGETAAALVVQGFCDQGLSPWPGRFDMYHHFTFRHCTGHGSETLSYRALDVSHQPWRNAPPQFWTVLDASQETEVEGPLVWGGFGLGADCAWDDWIGLNAHGAVVLICSGDPPVEALNEDGNPSLRSRVEHAREAGAVGLLLVPDPFKPVPLPNDVLDESLEDCGLPVFIVETALVDSLLGEVSLKRLVSQERRTHQRENTVLHREIRLKSSPLIDEIPGHNVLAAVPDAIPDERGWILLTAHHDHEGLTLDGQVLPGQMTTPLACVCSKNLRPGSPAQGCRFCLPLSMPKSRG